jgi:hypothetical protein
MKLCGEKRADAGKDWRQLALEKWAEEAWCDCGVMAEFRYWER